MSEAKRQQLIRALTALDKEEQAWVINFLVENLAGLKPKRKARKLHNDGFSDEQWEEYFAGQEPVELPTGTDSLDQILKATSGKTIKPIKKWL